MLAAAASVLTGKAMIGMGLRRPPEGWRRTVGILLRSESTRFALSAFALRVPQADLTGSPDDSLVTRIAPALVAFLAKEPDAHFCLEWRRPVTLRRRIAFVDLVVLRFAAAGTLEAVNPYLAPGGNSAPASPTYGRRCTARSSRHTTRRAAFRRSKDRAHSRIAFAPQSGRLSSVTGCKPRRRTPSACLPPAAFPSSSVISRIPRCASVHPPLQHDARSASDICRGSPAATTSVSSVDLWVSSHHVGLDGVPLQDLLDRLERAWGVAESVVFPSATPGQAFVEPHPCHAPGERPVDQLTTFVDLSPLLVLRQDLNKRYAGHVGGGVTLGTLIAWLLSQEPEFGGVRIASTVDVAASSGYERDVDVVSIRPADYATDERPWGGFIEFAREFNRQIAGARTRTSPVRAGMQTAGLIPAWAHAAVVTDQTRGTRRRVRLPVRHDRPRGTRVHRADDRPRPGSGVLRDWQRQSALG